MLNQGYNQEPTDSNIYFVVMSQYCFPFFITFRRFKLEVFSYRMTEFLNVEMTKNFKNDFLIVISVRYWEKVIE